MYFFSLVEGKRFFVWWRLRFVFAIFLVSMDVSFWIFLKGEWRLERCSQPPFFGFSPGDRVYGIFCGGREKFFRSKGESGALGFLVWKEGGVLFLDRKRELWLLFLFLDLSEQ